SVKNPTHGLFDARHSEKKVAGDRRIPRHPSFKNRPRLPGRRAFLAQLGPGLDARAGAEVTGAAEQGAQALHRGSKAREQSSRLGIRSALEVAGTSATSQVDRRLPEHAG